MPRFCILLFLAAFFLAETATAQPRKVESRRAQLDPELIAPLLERGELALVESRSTGRPWQVVTLSLMNAPASVIYDAVSQVTQYPKYLFSVEKAKILSRHRGMELSSWALNIPILGFKGKRVMRSKKPSLIEFKGVSGYFKHHHERWELIPMDDGKKTLVLMYRSVDLLNNGGFVLKTMISLEPSLEHGMYIAASFVQMQDLRRYVEKLPRAKAGRHRGPLPVFTRSLDSKMLRNLEQLMKLGELSLIESNPDGSLKQTTVMTAINAPREKVVAIARDVERYPEFVPNLIRYDASKRPGGGYRLDYEINAPIVNIEGQMNMDIGKNDEIRITAKSGDIKRGKWLWAFRTLGPNLTIPINYSYTDVTDASWFIRKLVEIQPLFEHGVVVASSTVQVKAIKERSEGRR